MRRVVPAALLAVAFSFPPAAPPAERIPDPAPRAALDLPAGWTTGDDPVPVEIRFTEPGREPLRFTVPRPVADPAPLPLPESVLRLPAGTVFEIVLSPERDSVRALFRLEADTEGPRVVPVAAPAILQVESALAYPNPFNPLAEDVTLSFTLNEDADVTVRVFDWNGDTVGTVFRGTGHTGANLVRWSGQAEDGRRLGNGVYMVRIEAVSGTRREPVVLRVALWNE